MKTFVLGVLLVGVVLLGSTVAEVGGRAPQGSTERGNPIEVAAARDGLVAFSTTVEQKYQQVTVIDPRGRVISVYHIDLVTGGITLRSVRNIHWDLQMSDFNGKAPLPREIQALAEQR
ncbi:MAG: hypothetical protein JW809_08490 [Pirellulales bacterium]|nr:hypothetical protein [Pirellulales bacterium]